LDGVFSFLKPPGITSHDAVSICRRVLRERRIGHSGTLDPLAYGVLPMFIGKATRIIEYTDSLEKTYVAECCLGYSTDTEDVTGEVLQSVSLDDITPPSMESLESLVKQFEGPQEQKPSIYSAIKINGKKAYELARAGQAVDLPSRLIHIYECKVLAYAFPYFTVQVRCSAGTYIRALLRDICLALGIPGTMTQLARTAVGSFSINESIAVEELEARGESVLMPVDRALLHLPGIILPEAGVIALKQGQTWPVKNHDSLLTVHELPGDNETDTAVANSDSSILSHMDTRLAVVDEMNKDEALGAGILRAYGPNGFFGVLQNKKTYYKVAKNIF